MLLLYYDKIFKSEFPAVFSTERIQKYLNFHSGIESKAIIHYRANILLSESFYPLLSVFEVALRNSLNRELSRHFATSDWYAHFATTPGLSDINREITTAIRHITKREETITGTKVVAELTLGFWVRLLNAEYELILWKSLRIAFPFMPKRIRQRHAVSVPLNKIRYFRNRVYHNEPVSWNFTTLETIHNDIMEVLGWLNNELPSYGRSVSRFNEVLKQAKLDIA
jgi:hypothetical protein